MKRALYSILAVLLCSCHASEKIIYLQDLELDREEAIVNPKDITVQPRDQISIVVSCKEPQLAMLFNLVEVTNRLGSQNTGRMSSRQGDVSGYTVDADGYIEFPILGRIYVAGMTRKQIADLIKDKLVSEDWIKDPTVTVEFLNLHFSVLGEVARPGQYAINDDRINLLEAISLAGDLTIMGVRSAVYVIREDNGKRIAYKVDLRSKDLFDSPVYYLQQNDIIYVEPNKIRAGQSTANENAVRSVSLWVSLASVITSIISIVSVMSIRWGK